VHRDAKAAMREGDGERQADVAAPPDYADVELPRACFALICHRSSPLLVFGGFATSALIWRRRPQIRNRGL
jgi:hypothetical protein